jgi:hypothetical protein
LNELDERIQALTEKVGGMESTDPGYEEAMKELNHAIAIRDHGEEGAKLREERAQVEKDLAEELQKGAESNKQRVADLESRYADILREINVLEQSQKQEERVQKQTEQLDVLGQQIQDMDLLGAILPEDQIVGMGIGLTEYGDMRQSLNQILHAWATDLKQADYKMHNEEVTALQAELQGVKEELRASGERETQLKRQNDELQKEIITKENTNDGLSRELNTVHMQNDDLNKIIDNGKADNERLVYENGNLRDHIAQLNRQLEEANKPKPTFTTTQSVQDQIEGLRKKSEESWAEKANRGLARFNLPAIETPALPEVKPLEVAQSGATFPEQTADHHGDSAAADSEVQQEGVTFQENTAEHGSANGLPVDGNTVKTEVVEQGTVSREEVTTINKRLDRLEKQAGIDERVA